MELEINQGSRRQERILEADLLPIGIADEYLPATSVGAHHADW